MSTVNTAINDVFVLRDNVNAAITGKVAGDFDTIEAYLISTPATIASVTLTEIGSGEYGIAFTPTVAGSWTAHVVYDSGGVFREFSASYDVESATGGDGGTPLTGLGTSLADLREIIASELDDFREATATATTGQSQFTSLHDLNEPDDIYLGCEALCISGSVLNVGKSRIVSGSDGASGSLDFGTPFPAGFTAGDIVHLFDRHGIGWTSNQIKKCINAAIRRLRGVGAMPIAASLTDEYTAAVALPDTFFWLTSVEYQDLGGFWRTVFRSPGNRSGGWKVDTVTGELEIIGSALTTVTNQPVRVLGIGMAAELSADSDETLIDSDWVVSEAMARLYHISLRDHPEFEKYVQYYQRVADDRIEGALPLVPSMAIRVR
jgi:hypothetical protein